jgi:hypothetical protein
MYSEAGSWEKDRFAVDVRHNCLIIHEKIQKKAVWNPE